MVYKKRNQFLFIGLILALFIVYQFAIKNTIALIREKNNLSTSFKQRQNEPITYKTLKLELMMLNNQLGYNSDIDTIEKMNFLEQIAAVSRETNVILKDFPEPNKQDKEGGFLIEVTRITLSGNYINLLRALDAIEKSSVAGRISSADFSIALDKEKRKQLLLNMYWKKISKKYSAFQKHDSPIRTVDKN
jgi:hypothetical protein